MPHYNAERWWCICCEKLTTIEKNPQWQKDGCPSEWEDDRYKDRYGEWLVRCADCKKQHFQQSGYECPECGCPSGDPYNELGNPEYKPPEGCIFEDFNGSKLLEIVNYGYNYSKAVVFGGNPVDWLEKWRCGICGTEYEFENSNC